MEAKHRNTYTPWIAGGALVVAIAVLLLIFRSHKTLVQADAQPGVSLATVRYGAYEERVTVTGRVGAPAGAQTKPAFAIAGVLASIDVHVGESVHAGQPLARLDTSGLSIAAEQAQAEAAGAAASFGGGAVPSAQVRTAAAKVDLARQRLQALQSGGASAQSDRTAAESALRQAQIKVEGDRRALARAEQLYGGGVVAHKDLETAQSQLAADLSDQQATRSRVAAATTGVGGALAQARADYAQALSDLRVAQAQATVLGSQAVSAGARSAAAARDYRNGTLYAPIDGAVTAIYKHRGESVDTTSAVVGIGPTSRDVVTLDVPANEARRVEIGAFVTVRVPGNGASSSGRVTGVSPAVDQTTQSAIVVVNATPPGALSGDAVEASIVVARDRGLIIPQSAVVQDPQDGNTVVFIQTKTKDGQAKFTQHSIVVLKSDGTHAEIRGLHVGERIAAQGAFQLLAPAAGDSL
ncbi:MAG: efflux RND transporter periplasmic adaptor subunit [Vulcanimicrobiaceae bacterium]